MRNKHFVLIQPAGELMAWQDLPKLCFMLLGCCFALIIQTGCTRSPAQEASPSMLATDATRGGKYPPTGAMDMAGDVVVPPAHAPWQIQYTGEIESIPAVEIFNLDLFETPASVFDALHREGVYVICYFSAGSYEDWRPDAGSFHSDLLGVKLKGWPGERWLDVSRIDLLAPIMEARLDLAAEKGCDGVDPDNVNGYLNDTGFDITPQDQLAFNRFLAASAHARGLAIGLKNDMEQAQELLPYFDWMLNEECFSYAECDLLSPFVQAGKPVFVIEYELPPETFCQQANQMGFNALHKNWELDAYAVDCHLFEAAR